MYNLDSIIKHPQDVEAKIEAISKGKAKRKPNFNDKELEMNLNRNHQIPCQNHHATVVPKTWVRSTGGWSGLGKEEWLRRELRDSSRSRFVTETLTSVDNSLRSVSDTGQVG